MVGCGMDLSPEALSRDIAFERRREFNLLAESVAHMVYCRTLPPDDAYWWGRIIAHQAHILGLVLPPDATPYATVR